jgi:hypothetical protein
MRVKMGSEEGISSSGTDQGPWALVVEVYHQAVDRFQRFPKTDASGLVKHCIGNVDERILGCRTFCAVIHGERKKKEEKIKVVVYIFHLRHSTRF